ncbi:hypothetical protein GMOD_00002622 [Pyrenophora seminiperda CCB06]|uniref:Uncharacterized protein n=1 Tax=Pyrenophora seminiperda CCB06 TaxID=1302712 RepID=A0A3M7M2T2_9PLEO|nr:hypothetical protein GMOD_00002622 [Pyrenophora seminiperda CCB06]
MSDSDNYRTLDWVVEGTREGYWASRGSHGAKRNSPNILTAHDVGEQFFGRTAADA